MTAVQTTMIVGSLMKHEEAIGRLYQLFAASLPGNSEFWNKLASEERAHAAVLRSLSELELAGAVTLRPAPLQTKMILESLEFITNKIGQIDTEGIDQRAALKVALDIERYMLESRFFEIYESDSSQMRPEFDELRVHTIKHGAQIAAALGKLEA